MRENFIDPITGETFTVPEFKLSFNSGNKVYKDKYGKEIVNVKTGNVLQYIERKVEKITVPFVSKYNPRTVEGQGAIKDYFGGKAHKFNTKGEGFETKDQKNRDFKSQLVERMKEGKL